MRVPGCAAELGYPNRARRFHRGGEGKGGWGEAKIQHAPNMHEYTRTRTHVPNPSSINASTAPMPQQYNRTKTTEVTTTDTPLPFPSPTHPLQLCAAHGGKQDADGPGEPASGRAAQHPIVGKGCPLVR